MSEISTVSKMETVQQEGNRKVKRDITYKKLKELEKTVQFLKENIKTPSLTGP